MTAQVAPELDLDKMARQCGEKVKYSAAWVAENAATAISWVREVPVVHRAYWCCYCDHWHLTSKTKRTIGHDGTR